MSNVSGYNADMPRLPDTELPKPAAKPSNSRAIELLALMVGLGMGLGIGYRYWAVGKPRDMSKYEATARRQLAIVKEMQKRQITINEGIRECKRVH